MSLLGWLICFNDQLMIDVYDDIVSIDLDRIKGVLIHNDNVIDIAQRMGVVVCV